MKAEDTMYVVNTKCEKALPYHIHMQNNPRDATRKSWNLGVLCSVTKTFYNCTLCGDIFLSL